MTFPFEVRKLHLEAVAAGLMLALPALYSQPASPRTFDVASIRKHEGPLRRMADYSASGPRLTLGAYNIPLLVMEAYNLRRYQLAFGAAAASLDDFYDITAVAPADPPPARQDFRQMLQSLLADRYKLNAHREKRELPVFALVVDRNGPSLTASSGDVRCAARIGPLHPEDRNYQYQYTNCPLDSLVDALLLDHPVVDRTGLSGRYDFTFAATPQFKMRDSSEPGDIAVEDAIRKLGLKLEPRKESIEVLVIDHVEKPTDN